jgi:SAM-dependent methyltransferase
VPSDAGNEIDQAIRGHYDHGVERSRLDRAAGRLELVRTQEILHRFLPAPPARVLDVGGGPGAHARWLTDEGYQVTVVDPVPLHVEQAGAVPGVTAVVGDARDLAVESESQDAVLLLGPLYHLPRAEERQRAWQEACRVVRPGGLVAAAAISRFASTHDGMRAGMLTDARFRDVVERDLASGEHCPPPDTPWFTTAYFHRPEELPVECEHAGLRSLGVYSVEGAAWMLPDADLDAWLDDPDRRSHFLWGLRQVEQEPSLLGASGHLLAIGRRPPD